MRCTALLEAGRQNRGCGWNAVAGNKAGTLTFKVFFLDDSNWPWQYDTGERLREFGFARLELFDTFHVREFEAVSYFTSRYRLARMAQKAAKTLATRNSARLRQTHLITLSIHVLFLLFSFTLRRSLSLTPYILLSLPALLIEAYLDILSRPTYSPKGDLKKAGEDLDAKGLTEFMWDILYWTWINLILVVILGNRGWWLYLVIPGYAVYAAAGAVSGVKGMMGGLAGGADEGDAAGAGSTSKRQSKMEKRGGQKMVYR